MPPSLAGGEGRIELELALLLAGRRDTARNPSNPAGRGTAEHEVPRGFGALELQVVETTGHDPELVVEQNPGAPIRLDGEDQVLPPELDDRPGGGNPGIRDEVSAVGEQGDVPEAYQSGEMGRRGPLRGMAGGPRGPDDRPELQAGIRTNMLEKKRLDDAPLTGSGVRNARSPFRRVRHGGNQWFWG
jgi:hypothetical protein